MALLRIIAVFILGLLGTTWSQNFYVAAPSKFRLNAVETIAIAIEGSQAVVVDVYIQDHPRKIKNVTHTSVVIQPDEPGIIRNNLDPAKFPPNFFDSPRTPKMVSVTVVSDKFRKDILVPITFQSGYVFMQMDKPIYTPNQRALIRILSLNEDTLPSDKPFKLQIKNPDNVIVEERFFSRSQSRNPIHTHVHRFPAHSMLGEWSATVRYGYELQQKTTVYFQLQDYVLPTFTVEVKTQDVIIPSTDIIKIGVVARYVYGKKVQGVVTFRIGVKRYHSPNVTFFATIGPKKIHEGFYELGIRTDAVKRHKDIGWFPAVEGSQLVVVAIVVDDATGNSEKATHINTKFLKSPFIISFKRCLPDFIPGLNSIFEADITYVDGRPAVGISTKIVATADGKPLNILDSAVSDEDGKVAFEILTELQHNSISVTLETNHPPYEGSQAVGVFEQSKFQSRNKAYISIARGVPRKFKPAEIFSKRIHFEPAGIRDIYYMIISRGKIIAMHKLQPGDVREQKIKFQITFEMVPIFRLVVFAHYRHEFIADSMKVDVERVCDPKAEVSIEYQFSDKEPGSAGAMYIRGTSGTWIGFSQVDESVYALSKKDLLTKDKMFDTIASHDLGCGPGGGLTVSQVLENAGIIMGTNHYTPPLLDGTGLKNQCCALGIQQNCQGKKKIFLRRLEEYNDFSKPLECCLDENDIIESKLIHNTSRHDCQYGCYNFDDLEFIPPEEEDVYERISAVRTDFRETHIFEDLRIESGGKSTYHVSLPHSITTWVVRWVSISPLNGMCVSEPQKIITFKKIFLHVNLPYSVAINEQVEIQATVFNYRNTLLLATLYMYGVKDLCTSTQTGQKSERKRFVIQPNSSHRVFFFVIPVKAEIFRIKLVLLSPEGSDIVEKYLRVLPQGVTKEVHIPIILDPTNRQLKRKLRTDTDQYSERIDPAKSLQVTAVILDIPEESVPESASFSITAMGGLLLFMEDFVKFPSAINNVDSLLQEPQGNCKENLMLLAPTLYAMRYLEVTKITTVESETKGYAFMRKGYANQLSFRKQDGTYAASPSKPTSIWLTTFIMKVFCQANKLIHVDSDAICSGMKWLINNQEPDGSYVEKNPIDHLAMMGGVQGTIPMTAFVLIALEECECDEENLTVTKKRAVTYLEYHLGDVSEPLHAAIVAYALALSGSALRKAANNKLLLIAKTDEDEKLMYWETQNSTQDIETAGYGLLTQLLFNNLNTSTAIVKWLNTKQLQSASGESIQDAVVALQSLSEYTRRIEMKDINLEVNITSSHRREFRKKLAIQDDNAHIIQNIRVEKTKGGKLFISAAGQGVGTLSVKLHYNVIEETCKFDVTTDASEPKQDEDREENTETVEGVGSREGICKRPVTPEHGFLHLMGELKAESLALYSCDGGRKMVGASASKCLSTGQWTSPPPKCIVESRVRRQNQVQDNNFKYIISICAKYLGNNDAEMSIVDVGVFPGFEPDFTKLKELEENPNHLIYRYENSSRGVAFYLRKVPIAEKYCFSFPVIRRYVVGNDQIRAAVKVYEYFNPEGGKCTKFYSPANYSPTLRMICEGGYCQCAEGGCPLDRALVESEAVDRGRRRTNMISIFCTNYDYVWKGKLDQPLTKGGGFLNVSFIVEEVIKEGIEKKIDIEGESRILLLSDYCMAMFPGQTIIGKDGQKYIDSEGITRCRYLLDDTSVVHLWTSIRVAKDRELQRALNAATKITAERGCWL